MRITLATRHMDRAFIPLALLYLKASLAGRGCCAVDDVAILEFGREAAAEEIARGICFRKAGAIVDTGVAVCRRRDIKADFYERFGALEFA